MKLLNITAVCLALLFTVACSSTKTVKLAKIEKKPLISDHHLMMSLLNRPMTEDQKLMLAFAKQQESYHQDISPVFVNAVMIKGAKSSEESNRRPTGVYSALIARDINAIRVSGPN